MPMKHIENNKSGHYILRAFGRRNHGKSTGKLFDVRAMSRDRHITLRKLSQGHSEVLSRGKHIHV